MLSLAENTFSVYNRGADEEESGMDLNLLAYRIEQLEKAVQELVKKVEHMDKWQTDKDMRLNMTMRFVSVISAVCGAAVAKLAEWFMR
jgi:hypothetical protein